MDDHGALPTPDSTPLQDLAFHIALLNLHAKVRKSSGQKKLEFESQQSQLQSSLLDIALETSSKWISVNPNKNENTTTIISAAESLSTSSTVPASPTAVVIA
mmetsp:Transcript_27898/g.67876  ORF Transcript_27898/g.67876 Transcript_27898/m.67876 type:complete len:102 (+) Transcript_27898:794-1099(+)